MEQTKKITKQNRTRIVIERHWRIRHNREHVDGTCIVYKNANKSNQYLAKLTSLCVQTVQRDVII